MGESGSQKTNILEGDGAVCNFQRICEVSNAGCPLRPTQAVHFALSTSSYAGCPLRPQTDARIEAHIFVSFLAYCLHATLGNLTRRHAAGLTPRAILETLLAEVRHGMPDFGYFHSLAVWK